MTALAPLAVAIPLLAAALLTATNALRRQAFAEVVGIAAAAATTTLCAILLAHTLGGHMVVSWMGGWRPQHGVAIGISLSVDTFGAAMATLAGVLMTAALVFAARTFKTVGHLFHALMLVFLAAMAGFALTGDLFNLFVFFELMSAAAYALTAYHVEARAPLEGAINFAITNSVGAFMTLSGVALVYGRTGALNLAQIGETLAQRPPDTLVAVAFALIVLGFLTKAAMVPVHFWLADAHAVAPVPVCVLFSGVMVQLGLYGVARVYWTAFSGVIDPHTAALAHLLIAFGVVTALVGGAMCVVERHLKRLLAFSTVSHTGMFLIGIGVLTGPGLAGTATYVLAHGFTKAGLFMCVGVLLHRFGEVDEQGLHGRGRRPEMALVGALMGVGALLLAALPMLGTFFGKSLIEDAALDAGYGWLPAVLTVASALTAGAVLRVTGRVFCGWGPATPPDDAQSREAHDEERDTDRERGRVPLLMLVPATLMMTVAVVVGLVPGVVHAVEHAATHFVDRTAYADAVLRGHARFTDLPTHPLATADFLYAAASVLGAVGVAAIGLFGRVPDAVVAPVTVLRRLHSGHVGDYVAWLTAALAVFGGLCALTLG